MGVPLALHPPQNARKGHSPHLPLSLSGSEQYISATELRHTWLRGMGKNLLGKTSPTWEMKHTP